jgi:hypothetical protein
MLDIGSETIAIVTVAAVGFGFHTGVPVLVSRWPRVVAPQPEGQLQIIDGRPPPTATDLALDYFRYTIGSTRWLVVLVLLSIPYIASDFLALASIGSSWPAQLSVTGAPDALRAARLLLLAAVGLTLLGWVVILALCVMTGLAHWWTCWRNRSGRAKLIETAKMFKAYFERGPKSTDDRAVQSALEELRRSAKNDSPPVQPPRS